MPGAGARCCYLLSSSELCECVSMTMCRGRSTTTQISISKASCLNPLLPCLVSVRPRNRELGCARCICAVRGPDAILRILTLERARIPPHTDLPGPASYIVFNVRAPVGIGEQHNNSQTHRYLWPECLPNCRAAADDDAVGDGNCCWCCECIC